ncbi:hypothetical protein P8452_38850 [Trifolium repens]|nr:hypothetical protein P8452_38850 [Trifolium repens]
MAENNSQSPIPCNNDHNHDHEQVAGFDWMVLVAAILCAIVCALGLNTMLQCAFQCLGRVVTEPMQWIATRRLNSGIKKKEMVALPTSTYCDDLGSPSSASSCVICLAEFCNGDQIRHLTQV